MSVVSWLDFRADDLARARDFIKAFQEEGVLDELGFLALQTRFSDVFHPATSTLMRSSRYLYFVAGIYRQLEREGVSANNVRAEARRRQDALREVLATTETVGVIGRDATLEVKQLPSAVYWSSLRSLGMFVGGTSEAAYQSSFDEFRRERRGYVDDDKVAQADVSVVNWDPDLPLPAFLSADGTVRPGTTFRLTKQEATDLARRYHQLFGASLLSLLLKRELADTPYPWMCPRPPETLKPYLEHGKMLSLLARGTTLQYYQLVIEEQDRLGIETPGDIVRPAFAQWWSEARHDLRGWRPEQLTTLPAVAAGLRHERYADVRFMSDWLRRMEASASAASLLDDVPARKHVRDRELAVKPLKARLKHPKHLKQWRAGKIGQTPYQLDYRHPVGSRFVSEILAGIARR